MIGSIVSGTDSIESLVNHHIIPCKCKSCGSTTAIFESLSGYFKLIPVLLPIKLGHITVEYFPVPKIENISPSFTINEHFDTT